MTWNTFDSLQDTWERIKTSRGRDGRRNPSVGLDGVTHKIFDQNQEKNIGEIERKLTQPDPNNPSSPAYKFAPFRNKIISSEPGKLREIQIPRIRDQIVLRALSDEISTSLIRKDSSFLKTSPRKVVKQVIAARAKGMKHVLRTDIHKYYPSIPHQTILDKLILLQAEPKIVHLIKKALTVPFRDTRLGKSADRPTTIGTATGTSLSTVLGEFYLMDLGKSLSPDGAIMIRYMDDILILTEQEEELSVAHQKLLKELDALGLQLSKHKTSVKSFELGFEFLGFSFDDNQVRITENKAIKWIRSYQGITRKFARAIENSPLKNDRLSLLERMVREINREISGAIGMQIPYYSLANDLTAFKDLDRQIRETIGGMFRRLGTNMDGSYRIESAFSWAWKYKKHYQSAQEEALRKFPEIFLD